MVRKLIAATAVIVLSAGAAPAQVTGPIPNTPQDNSTTWNMWAITGSSRTPEDAGREHEIERKYQETLKTKIPDKKVPNDPWRNIRQAPAATVVDRHKPQ